MALGGASRRRFLGILAAAPVALAAGQMVGRYASGGVVAPTGYTVFGEACSESFVPVGVLRQMLVVRIVGSTCLPGSDLARAA
jgi:hypothetical protein